MCGIASAAGLNVHLTSHFSYAFSDARIEKIVRSGVTHLTVAVDGATQETYGVTRVNGRLDWVLSNLERVVKYRRGQSLRWPTIEIQHLQHVHHPAGEVDRVRDIVSAFGIDQFTTCPGFQFTVSGDLANVVDLDMEQFEVGEPYSPKTVPLCKWPYVSMFIRYNGDVIPCCFHRAARQHTGLDGRAIIGNVFEESLLDVWNNDRYRANRQLVSDPTAMRRRPSLKESFCYGCGLINDLKPKSPGRLVQISSRRFDK